MRAWFTSTWKTPARNASASSSTGVPSKAAPAIKGATRAAHHTRSAAGPSPQVHRHMHAGEGPELGDELQLAPPISGGGLRERGAAAERRRRHGPARRHGHAPRQAHLGGVLEDHGQGAPDERPRGFQEREDRGEDRRQRLPRLFGRRRVGGRRDRGRAQCI